MLIGKQRKEGVQRRKNHRMFPFVSAVLLCAALLWVSGISALAKDVPDVSRRGSVRVTMREGDTVVGGGSLTIYHVGDVMEENGNYGFAATEEFAGCKESLSENLSAELAQALAQYVEENKTAGITKTIGKDGQVVFSELEQGLYLLLQRKAADGYKQVTPFLVSVPFYEEGTYVYDVDASPKVELEKDSTPAVPSTPQDPQTPSVPAEPTLPKTGQLNWPIPVLAFLGLSMFSVGWALRFGNKRMQEEH